MATNPQPFLNIYLTHLLHIGSGQLCIIKYQIGILQALMAGNGGGLSGCNRQKRSLDSKRPVTHRARNTYFKSLACGGSKSAWVLGSRVSRERQGGFYPGDIADEHTRALPVFFAS